MTAGLRFEAVTRELVRAWRYAYSGSDGKGCQQDLAVRVPVELKAIAGLEPDIDWCHEIFPGFEYSLRVCIADVFVFKELLANPTERTALGRAGLIGAESIGATCPRARQKSKQRFQRVAKLVHTSVAIKQVVRIVGAESPSDPAAGPNVTLSGRCVYWRLSACATRLR